MAHLADYDLVRVLAQGGMGVVHEALERATGRRVALKRILAGALDDEAQARFLVEGRALARLDHPAIVRVHALEQAPGGPFMVMDLVQGESLERTLAREGPLAPERALALARALTDALEHAHRHGVLHRDLKPANVLVDERGEAKLIDFGLAKLQVAGGSLAHLTRTGEVLGTPAYMAPEQANGGAVDARTDVYGLGATLFALLTGRPPFTGTSAIAVLEAVLTRAPAPPSRLRPGLPRWLDDVVLECLAKDPARRPDDMAALRARLEGVTSARAGSRGVVLLATAALAAAALGATAIASRSSSLPPSTLATAPRPTPAPLASSSPAAIDTRGQALARALREAEAAAATAPERVDAWLELARARARLGDVEAALAPPPATAPPAAWLAHGQALLAAERFDDALAALSCERLADDRQAALDRLQALARAGELRQVPFAALLDHPEADRLSTELARDPTWTAGVYARERFLLAAWGQAHVAAARESAAALRERGALALAARLEAATDERADVLAALRHLDLAVDVAPTSAPARLERAQLLHRVARSEEAERELTRALELDPLLAAAWRYRANVRAAAGRHREAAADARQELALLGPATAWERDRVFAPATLLKAGRHLDEALGELVALRAVRATAGLELEVGAVLALMGDAEGARAAWRRVLDDRLPGRVSDYMQAAERLTPGQPATGWQEPFLAYLRTVEDPAEWVAAAELLRMLGHAAPAGVIAEGAVLRGGGAPALAIRARTRAARGQREEALKDWDEVLRLVSQEAAPSAALAPGASSSDATLQGALSARVDLRYVVGDVRGALADARALRDLQPEGSPSRLTFEQAAEQVELELRARDDLRRAVVAALRGDAVAALRLLAAIDRRAGGPHFLLAYGWAARTPARAGFDPPRVLSLARTALERAAAQRAPADLVEDLRRALAQTAADLERLEAATDDPERARALLALGRHRAAAEVLERLAASSPDDRRTTFDLAASLRASGALERAAAWFARLAGGEDELGLRARLCLAALELEHGNAEIALGLVEASVVGAASPALTPTIEVERSGALLALGRADAALAAADRALALADAAPPASWAERSTTRARGLAARAEALRRLERPGQARAALLEALELATTLSLDEHHALKLALRERALALHPDDLDVQRWADRAFP